jgi:hypothetical protein
MGASALRPQTPRERRVVLSSIGGYALVAAVALSILLWQEEAHGLLLLGAVVAGIFLAQIIFKRLGRQSRMTAEWIGALGLTSTAAGAYYVVTGELEAKALVLWGANWLFAANQIHFVQLRIHAAKASSRREKLACGTGFLLGECATALLLMLAWRTGVLPGLALAAFGPVLGRGIFWFLRRPRPLAIHQLGFSELGHALLFGGLFILGFQLTGPQ